VFIHNEREREREKEGKEKRKKEFEEKKSMKSLKKWGNAQKRKLSTRKKRLQLL